MQPRPTKKTLEPKRDRRALVDRDQHEISRFESLVGELSAAMARAPADEVDREIESWLGKICRALDLDRSAVYERDSPDQPVRATHTWVRPNFPAFPKNYEPEKLIQRSTQLVMSGEHSSSRIRARFRPITRIHGGWLRNTDLKLLRPFRCGPVAELSAQRASVSSDRPESGRLNCSINWPWRYGSLAARSSASKPR